MSNASNSSGDRVRLAPWFPNAPSACKANATAFFECFTENSMQEPGERVRARVSPLRCCYGPPVQQPIMRLPWGCR